jgi:hypothetical protein
MKRRNLLTAAALGTLSLSLGVTLTQSAQAADVPGVAFVYLGNPGMPAGPMRTIRARRRSRPSSAARSR